VPGQACVGLALVAHEGDGGDGNERRLDNERTDGQEPNLVVRSQISYFVCLSMES